MIQTIILNSSHIQNLGSGNNILKYTFPAGGVRFKDNSVALTSFQCYYCWDSIGAANANNGLQYVWIDGLINSATIPDGNWTVAQLNAYLQSVMVVNGHYLIDSSGNYKYHLEIVTSSFNYSCLINAYIVPTALPSGYPYPTGATWAYPATSKCAQIMIGSISSILGFSAGNYPPTQQATNYSAYSSSTPQLSSTSSILMTCSLINNKISYPSNILYSFMPVKTYFSK